jgi:hypothetical protein
VPAESKTRDETKPKIDISIKVIILYNPLLLHRRRDKSGSKFILEPFRKIFLFAGKKTNFKTKDNEIEIFSSGISGSSQHGIEGNVRFQIK